VKLNVLAAAFAKVRIMVKHSPKRIKETTSSLTHHILTQIDRLDICKDNTQAKKGQEKAHHHTQTAHRSGLDLFEI